MKNYKPLTIDWWADKIKYKDKKSLIGKFNLFVRLNILEKVSFGNQENYFIPLSNYCINNIISMAKAEKLNKKILQKYI